jgi:hypothetical protein
MNVSTLSGETTASEASELLKLLRQRFRDRYASCWLSHDLYPALYIEINDQRAWLNFFEVEDLPGFISQGAVSDDAADIEFLDDSKHVTERPASWVIDTATAEQAALEFFESGKRPACVSWLEL